MAIIGRRACPWCGFGHAHVKQNEGKLPYHHCPSCGLITQAKNGHQAELLTKGMGPKDSLKLPEPPSSDNPIVVPKAFAEEAIARAKVPAAPPVVDDKPKPKPRPAGLWDQLMHIKKDGS